MLLDLQNTIAGLKALIPTLEAAFTSAGIMERASWEAAGENLLSQLEAETEGVRLDYVASQHQPPRDLQPELASSPEAASTA